MNDIARNAPFAQPSPCATSTLSVDLVRASYRASTFPQEWSLEKREAEAKRYEMFLKLAAKTRGRATPTLEIDELWHLHMLHPVAYYRDCMHLFGHILDHDGGFGTAAGELPILKASFRQFAADWLAEYGTPYVEALPDDASSAATNCWHDCQSRCWHACGGKVHASGE
jgi:hypothetical protein